MFCLYSVPIPNTGLYIGVSVLVVILLCGFAAILAYYFWKKKQYKSSSNVKVVPATQLQRVSKTSRASRRLSNASASPPAHSYPRGVVKTEAEAMGCPYCLKFYPTEKDVNEHISLRHPGKSLVGTSLPTGAAECPHCKKIYPSREDLNTHVDLRHNPNSPNAEKGLSTQDIK